MRDLSGLLPVQEGSLGQNIVGDMDAVGALEPRDKCFLPIIIGAARRPNCDADVAVAVVGIMTVDRGARVTAAMASVADSLENRLRRIMIFPPYKL